VTENVPGPSPAAVSAAFGMLAGGVVLVTVADGRDDVGLTATSFCPVSHQPALVAVALMAESYPAELLSRVDLFAVTVLAAGQRMLAGRFAAAGRPGARLLLDGVPHSRGQQSGALIPDAGLAALECRATQRVPAGDHLLVLAAVTTVPYLAESGVPLVRFGGAYPAVTAR
jgi:flavin reductase (DIM6/NTAB) family NADH-FMN oxidoreductase RutF